jgi:hypothetical protein
MASFARGRDNDECKNQEYYDNCRDSDVDSDGIYRSCAYRAWFRVQVLNKEIPLMALNLAALCLASVPRSLTLFELFHSSLIAFSFRMP